MWTSGVAALALLSSGAVAFKNTSPFFLFSTSDLSVSPEQVQVASAPALAKEIADVVSDCPSDAYIIVSQPGVSEDDYRTKSSAPSLQQLLNSTYSTKGRTAWTIPEVVGLLDTDSLSRALQGACGATVVTTDASTGDIPSADVKPRIVKIDFDGITASATEDRISVLAEHDSFLHAVISSIGGQSYTVLYFTTPRTTAPLRSDPAVYSMDSDYESLHTDLKRELRGRAADSGNRTASDLPLFEKYQFLSTGIFVGLVAAFILLSIMYVALSAISGLEVSYFAFSKEMGPSGQKKQQ